MRFFLLVLIAASSFFITGCATDSQPSDPNRVSSIPWNRPEKWEGQGPMGGMMNTR